MHPWLTHRQGVVPLIDANIRLNKRLHPELASCELLGRAYPWGTDTPISDLTSEPLDMLVMSDVVYDPQFYEPLVASLSNLVTSSDILCIMAHRHRHPEDHKFFDLLQRAGFDLADIRHNPSEALQHACQDVRLLRIERRAARN